MSGPSTNDLKPTPQSDRDHACKRCGGLESLGAQFRPGSYGKRRLCRACENAKLREKRAEKRGAEEEAPALGGGFVVLGDVHYPFASGAAMKWALAYIAEHKPRHVVQVGDLYDRYSQSRFPRLHSVITPADELSQGREQAEAMWQAVRARSPRSARLGGFRLSPSG
jgi:hypothetical protein